MENTLKDFPDIGAAIAAILATIMHGDFEALEQQRLAGPARADEYRTRLRDLLMGRVLTPLPETTLAEGMVFQDSRQAGNFIIELPLYTNEQASEIFAVFHARCGNEGAHVRLYDILVP